MLRCFLLFALVVTSMVCEASAQDRSYGRSMVISDRGIVATSQYLASQPQAELKPDRAEPVATADCGVSSFQGPVPSVAEGVAISGVVRLSDRRERPNGAGGGS